MARYIHLIISFMGNHTTLALVIVFLIALGEAVFILGLFVPSTPVLVGSGTLIAAGILPFAAVFVAASLGAIFGDAISYWLGKVFGERIRQFWLFHKYSDVIDKGEFYFLRHGSKSVFIGRFIPGIKAVIPGIAGITGMDIMRFTYINVISALVWTAAHLLPGMGIGLGINSLITSGHEDILFAFGAISLVLFVLWLVAAVYRKL